MAIPMVASPASAFVRETVDGSPDTPLFWASRAIEVRPAYTSSTDVPESALRSAVLRALSTWETAGDGCTDIALTAGEPPTGLETSLAGASRDGENRVVWREDEWTEDPSALALTTLIYRRDTGEILDADIDINGVDHFWTVTDDPGAVVTDVQNTVTHELGHVLGFGHSEEVEATMYGRSPPGETKKRDLDTDDVAAVCTVYPFGEPTPGGLGVVHGGLTSASSCAVHGPPSATPAGAPAMLLAALALLWLRRRFPNRRCR